jgi:ribose 5-phosphate isomerase B
MKIAIGCDHRGLEVKKAVIKQLQGMNIEVKDFGTNSEDSCDYPDYAGAVAKSVAAKENDLGILICDTGIGMSIAANKVDGVRAALCCNAFYAERARLHNNANVVCIAGREGTEHATGIVSAFLQTNFEGGRHQKRLDKISALEC